MSSASINQDRPVLFINVVIEDASEAIKQGVADQISQKNLPEGLKKRLAKRIGNFAANAAPVAAIVDKMIPNMLAEMPVKMKPNGLTVHAEEVFREGPMFVLAMQVQHVDAVAMVEAKKISQEEGEQESAAVRAVKWLLNLMGVKLADSVQTNHLPAFVQAKMQPKMGEMMKGEMAEKRMKASIEVLPEDQEARFFFAMLSQIRAAESAKETTKAPPKLPPNPFRSKKSE